MKLIAINHELEQITNTIWTSELETLLIFQEVHFTNQSVSKSLSQIIYKKLFINNSAIIVWNQQFYFVEKKAIISNMYVCDIAQ